MNEAFSEVLRQILPKERLFLNEPMKAHTTFQIGGPADYFAEPADEEELNRLIQAAKEAGIPWFVLGKGSNLVVCDEGFRGLIIHIGPLWNEIEIQGTRVRAGSGILLSSLASALQKQGLTGFECASGIPGSLGGAVYMNAGAYGFEMKDCLVEIRILDEFGLIQSIPAAELELGYRTSLVQHKPWVVLEATMEFEPGDPDAIRAKMTELLERRREKQPVEKPSAGSVFKRPEGYYAGALISDCGLKGYQIGGAQVSEKHAGFIINAGGATAADVIALVTYVKEQVQERFGVTLEPELKILRQTSLICL